MGYRPLARELYVTLRVKMSFREVRLPGNMFQFKKIMERRFKIIDRSQPAAQTSANFSFQVHDYV